MGESSSTDVGKLAQFCPAGYVALFEELLHIHIGPERVGNTSLVHRFEIVRAADGVVLSEGALVQVCLSMPSRDKARVPDALRAAIDAHGGLVGAAP